MSPKIIISFTILLLQTFIYSAVLAQDIERGARSVFTQDNLSIGETFALVIGISSYENIRPLNDADKDASAFTEFLTGPWGMNIPYENIRLMLNAEAKSEDIMENGIQWLEEKCKPGDRAIIYFAGHGVSVGNNDSYLLAQNVSSKYNKANILYSGGIQLFSIKRNFIEPMHRKGVQVLLIVDACRNFDTNKESEGVSIFSASTFDENTGEIRILSSVNGMASLEGNPTWKGHGAFTFALLRGLYGEADYNNDGQISFAEIRRYLNITLPELTNMKQEPSICCDQHRTVNIHKLPVNIKLSSFQQKLKEENQPKITIALTEARGAFRNNQIPNHLRSLFDTFYKSLEKKMFFGKGGADESFNIIASLLPSESTLMREAVMNYCSALGNDVQHAINKYIQGDENILYGIIQSKEDDGWGNFFQQKTLAAARWFELREQYYPNHSYNQVVELKYLFVKARSLYGIDNKMALEMIKNGLKIDSSQTYLLYLASLLSTGEESLYFNTKCISLNPEFKYAINRQGILYQNQGKYQEAQKFYLKVIELDKDAIYAYCNLGHNFRAQKKHDIAEQWYTKALQIDSNYLEALIGLGANFYEKRDYRNALESYSKAIKLDSSLSSAYFGLALVFQEQERFRDAERLFLIANTLESNATFAFSLANLFGKQKQYHEAIKWYSITIDRDSSFATAYLRLGDTYNTISNSVEAQKWYIKALKFDSTSSHIYLQLGQINFDLEKYMDAIKWLDMASIFDKHNEDIQILLGLSYLNLGNRSFQNQDYQTAEKWYQKAQQQNLEHQLKAGISQILERINILKK